MLEPDESADVPLPETLLKLGEVLEQRCGREWSKCWARYLKKTHHKIWKKHRKVLAICSLSGHAENPFSSLHYRSVVTPRNRKLVTHWESVRNLATLTIWHLLTDICTPSHLKLLASPNLDISDSWRQWSLEHIFSVTLPEQVKDEDKRKNTTIGQFSITVLKLNDTALWLAV